MSIDVRVEDLNNDAYLRGIDAGVASERERISHLLQRILCFDFQAEGFCTHHRGKCKDIQELWDRLNP